MAKKIEGVYEKVLECAKYEFLKNGFKEASLRTIAQNAGTSTGSIYTRFSDKNGLFDALVLPVVNELKEWFCAEQEDFHKLPDETKKEYIFDYSADKIDAFVDYIYDNFDVFKLLITCSDGTSFSDFIHDFVDIDVEYTIKFIESTGNDALISGRVSEEFLHIISSAFHSGVFEIVVHDMTREAANVYMHQLRQFFLSGWRNIFNP